MRDKQGYTDAKRIVEPKITIELIDLFNLVLGKLEAEKIRRRGRRSTSAGPGAAVLPCLAASLAMVGCWNSKGGGGGSVRATCCCCCWSAEPGPQDQ